MTDFVVAWEDDSDKDGVYQIFCCGFNADGTKSFTDRMVNTVICGNKVKPRVAMAENGDFVIVWMDKRAGCYRIFIRGFTSNGIEKFSERRISAVNGSNTNFDERDPDIAMATDGSFKVVWADGRGAVERACSTAAPCTAWNNYEIYLRAFSSNGTPDSTEQIISTIIDDPEWAYLWESKFCPAIGITPNGAICVVAWMAGLMEEFKVGYSNGYFGADKISDQWSHTTISKVHFRGFKKDGTELFPTKLAVDDGMMYASECFPSVSVDLLGEIVIAYTENCSNQVVAKGFNSNGELLADVVVKPEFTNGNWGFRPSYPRVVGFGHFIVVWMDDDPPRNGLFQIKSRKFSSTGQPSTEKTVNTDCRGDQARPDIAINLVKGDYVVVWEDDTDENHVYQIKARRIKGHATGISFSDMTVNTNYVGQQLRPTVAMKLVTAVTGKDCFIATAAFGTSMVSEIDVLRSFRDKKMLTSRFGRKIAKLYYQISPPIAGAIASSKISRKTVRTFLKPVVKFFKRLGY